MGCWYPMKVFVVSKVCWDYDNAGNCLLAVMTDRPHAFRLAEQARDMCAESERPYCKYGIEVEEFNVDDVAGVGLRPDRVRPELTRLDSNVVLRLEVPKLG